jgi:hypothetical protein
MLGGGSVESAPVRWRRHPPQRRTVPTCSAQNLGQYVVADYLRARRGRR